MLSAHSSASTPAASAAEQVASVPASADAPASAAASAAAPHAAPATLIEPLGRPLSGAMRVPGDKSVSHRSILFAAMAEGTSRVSGVLDSADVRSSIAAVTALGAQVSVGKQPDGSLAGTVTGWGADGPRQPEGPVYCGNSGTTVRLLMGVLAPWDISVELTGDESLSRRPMRRITGPLALMGARFLPEGRETLPITTAGSAQLRGVTFDSPVASAQLKTALLLAGVFAEGTTTVNEPAPSRNHTELMLPAFGVPVGHAPGTASVTGPCRMHAADVVVPGDPSSAAFIACAAALAPGSCVTIEDVGLAPARIGFARVLERMGARIEVTLQTEEGREPCGRMRIEHTPALFACEVLGHEIASMVDEIPVLALVAARAQGTTVFRGIGELRVKETDRLQAILDGLGQLGVRAWAEGDDLFVEGAPGRPVPAGLTFDSRGDHRLAMTWSLVALTGAVPVSVVDFDCVCVSYPQFLNDMQRLAR